MEVQDFVKYNFEPKEGSTSKANQIKHIFSSEPVKKKYLPFHKLSGLNYLVHYLYKFLQAFIDSILGII
jgi:hypothetical protein